ncbi:SpaH/EbpB family LPXTG-anchored major pilin [Lacticaseibacillus mingshuiensis]|uniref:SpaH/EbpB family LPXTG-anchored major pilin n=1 Tax=Lacticaseibacillus mingshuiensis TaxID=2799574 RepID=A0ABW4CMD9_9LACO|nr:SpaH/EbpB family LPXTG-anchored major pilin [Lacticaseibacillus mingshuiensis]
MSKRWKALLAVVAAFLMLLGVALSPAQATAAAQTQAPTTVDIVLHKLLFDETLPDKQANDGAAIPDFGQSARPLNGVTFTVYDITTDFWTYVADGHDVTAAQAHFANTQADFSRQAVVSHQTAGSGEARFAGLTLRENGQYAVYLFKETGTPAGIDGQSQNLVVVLPLVADGQIQSQIDLFPKNVVSGGETTIAKTVTANRTNFAYGETIPYKIAVTVPADIGALKTFAISDSANAELVRHGGIHVAIDGQPVAASAGLYQVRDATPHSFSLAFDVTQLTGDAGKTITVTYDMAIKAGTPADELLVNRAIVYPGGDDPQQDYTVDVTGGKRFIKVDAKSEQPLAGAIFVVKNDQGAYLIKAKDGWAWKNVSAPIATSYKAAGLATLTSGKDGRFAIQGLAAGHYSLVEVRAPAGYVRNTKAIAFQIVAGEYTRGQTDPYKVVNVASPTTPDKPVSPTQPHHPTPRLWDYLPHTGSAWASWLSAIGVVVIALVLALRYRNRRSVN